MRDGRLLVVPALRARAGADGSFLLTRKFVDGIHSYVRLWPGRVHVAVQRTDQPDGNLDPIAICPGDQPFELSWAGAGASRDGELLRGAAVALVTLTHDSVPLADLAARASVPLVYVSEYSVRTRRQIVRAETANPLLRWRREWWTWRLEGRYRRAVRLAAGVQCNGTPTYEAYKPLSRNALLYFDTRVSREELAGEADVEARLRGLRAGGPLRLVFSGRLAAMKGADHLPRVAAELRRLGVDFSLDVFGGGPLEAPIRQDLARLGLEQAVRLHGAVDFARELMPYVAKKADLFVCCHVQGDPSCTYLETLSCGVPIAGYDNEAFAGLVRSSGVGWTTSLGDPGALARRIAELARDREALARQARQALAFASEHTFERTMRQRVAHLEACA
jgi:colanic acid/amylovoran biosynthesis glycosyltransferase